jgi:hypothetical protein
MRFFPQLLTGASGQYPIVRRWRVRTIINEGGDGSRVKYADSGTAELVWEIRLRGLRETERQELEGLFDAVEGRLGTFVFLDPVENLLAKSGDLGAAIWAKDGLLVLEGGVADVWGGAEAWRINNSGQTAQRVVQDLPGPGQYQYCLSVYVRSAAGGIVRLVRRSGGVEELTTVHPGPSWRRVTSAGRLEGGSEGIHFGLEVPAGGAVEVCGMQVEAQRGATAYKKTSGHGGVHAPARFAQDDLDWVTTGLDMHSTVVRIRSRAQE